VLFVSFVVFPSGHHRLLAERHGSPSRDRRPSIFERRTNRDFGASDCSVFDAASTSTVEDASVECMIPCLNLRRKQRPRMPSTDDGEHRTPFRRGGPTPMATYREHGLSTSDRCRSWARCRGQTEPTQYRPSKMRESGIREGATYPADLRSGFAAHHAAPAFSVRTEKANKPQRALRPPRKHGTSALCSPCPLWCNLLRRSRSDGTPRITKSRSVILHLRHAHQSRLWCIRLFRILGIDRAVRVLSSTHGIDRRNPPAVEEHHEGHEEHEDFRERIF